MQTYDVDGFDETIVDRAMSWLAAAVRARNGQGSHPGRGGGSLPNPECALAADLPETSDRLGLPPQSPGSSS